MMLYHRLRAHMCLWFQSIYVLSVCIGMLLLWACHWYCCQMSVHCIKHSRYDTREFHKDQCCNWSLIFWFRSKSQISHQKMISKSNQNQWFQIDLNRNHTFWFKSTNHEIIKEHNVRQYNEITVTPRASDTKHSARFQ